MGRETLVTGMDPWVFSRSVLSAESEINLISAADHSPLA
jgi:hypothetical protein